jgi:hypothetical protein
MTMRCAHLSPEARETAGLLGMEAAGIGPAAWSFWRERSNSVELARAKLKLKSFKSDSSPLCSRQGGQGSRVPKRWTTHFRHAPHEPNNLVLAMKES